MTIAIRNFLPECRSPGIPLHYLELRPGGVTAMLQLEHMGAAHIEENLMIFSLTLSCSKSSEALHS